MLTRFFHSNTSAAVCGSRDGSTQRAWILKKINLAWTLENFKFSLEIYNLAWKLQSRLKFSILTLRNPHKNRGLVGGSLEIFNLAWKCHSFQSRLKISIPEGDLELFQDLGPLGATLNCGIGMRMWGKHIANQSTKPFWVSPLFYKVTRSQLEPFFVLKFVRSRALGARFLQPFPRSLVTVKYYSHTKKWPLMAVNSR